MNGALLSALEKIEREKGIDKNILLEAIESALVSAARKVIDDPNINKEDITVDIDEETGEICIFNGEEEVESKRFGRIAAQTAKQVMMQKIREAERDVISEKYQKKTEMIISGSVHRFEKGDIIVELDDTEAILPRSEQIPRERFRQGEIIRAYLLKVDRTASGLKILLSRSCEGFVKKLFELEVPEISQGIVEIKALAREPGERTKMAVCSKDEKVDPVGACVGMRGSRVRDIVKELHGERIDVIRWDDDIREYLPAAVSPAEISKMAIDRENERITLTVPKDQLSLLIGKKGRNIRLASKLLGWELVAEAIREVADISIAELKGIGKKTLERLEEAGYNSLVKLLGAGVEGLLEVEGVGEKTAQKVIDICEAANTAALEKAAAKFKEDEKKKLEEKPEALGGDKEGDPISEDSEAPAEASEEKTVSEEPADSADDKEPEASAEQIEDSSEESDAEMPETGSGAEPEKDKEVE